MLFKSWI